MMDQGLEKAYAEKRVNVFYVLRFCKIAVTFTFFASKDSDWVYVCADIFFSCSSCTLLYTYACIY